MEAKYRGLWLRQTTDEFLDVFGESSTPLAKMQGASLVVKDGALALADMDREGFQVVDGQRRTLGNPPDPQSVIYLVGPSYTYSAFCRDEETIASRLQELCNTHLAHKKYAIKNCGVTGGTLELFTLRVKELPLNKGDIVIMLSHTNGVTHEKSWQVIKMQQHICNEKGARYCFFLYPRWDQMLHPSEREKKLLNSTYKELYENRPAGTRKIISPKKYILPSLLMKLTAIGCPNYDLQHWIERSHSMGELLVDRDHVEAKGHFLFAHAIFASYVEQLENEEIDSQKLINEAYWALKEVLGKYYSEDSSINEWIESNSPHFFPKDGSKGSIVMNCNPFTLGHLHIIEEALKQVDFLYIFVVQENLSDFSFTDRVKLIKSGTAHLGDRVAVIASGKFIISSFSFPEYFEKQALKDIKVDTSHDVTLFGAVIAPRLNIKVRFIGEEPFCAVTSQYNRSLKTILPKLGVFVVELPRLKADNHIISASLVRKYLEDGKMDKLKKLVPETTYNFLIKHPRCGASTVPEASVPSD